MAKLSAAIAFSDREADSTSGCGDCAGEGGAGEGRDGRGRVTGDEFTESGCVFNNTGTNDVANGCRGEGESDSVSGDVVPEEWKSSSE